MRNGRFDEGIYLMENSSGVLNSQVKSMQKELDYYKDLDYKHGMNTYEDYIGKYINVEQIEKFSTDITNVMTEDDLVKLLSSPDTNKNKIERLIKFYLYTNSNMGQTIDIPASLPSLNYSIKVIERSNQYEKNITLLNKMLLKVKHKYLTRQLLNQCLAEGTVCGIWLGSTKEPYPYVFQDLRYFFPVDRSLNTWEIIADLEYFDAFKEEERVKMFEKLSPHITQAMYNAYKTNPTENKYVSLPTDKTFSISTKTYKFYQRYGIGWLTPLLMDENFKKKMKNMDKAIADKFIKNILLCTIGNEKYPYEKISKGKKRSLLSGVKKAIQNAKSDQSATIVGVPEWTKIENLVPKSNIDKDKYDNVSKDINVGSNGVNGILEGTASFSAGKNVLELNYSKVSTIIEQIEYEVMNKLFNMVLPKGMKDNYYIDYSKSAPLSGKEKVNILKSLNDKGFAVKPLIDMIEGIEYSQFIDQSLYEIETLDLPNKIVPYQTSFTMNGSETNGESGADENTDSNSQSKDVNTNNDGNNNPTTE